MSNAIVLLGILIAIGVEAAASPRHATRAPPHFGAPLRVLATLAGPLLLASSIVAVVRVDGVVTAVASAAFVVLGGGTRAAAMYNLGPHFRTEGGGDTLVTTGIHGVMRHPSELGLLAWVVGLSLAAPGPLALVLASTQLGLLTVRLWLEESALAARFGGTWDRYAATTPRFGLPIRGRRAP